MARKRRKRRSAAVDYWAERLSSILQFLPFEIDEVPAEIIPELIDALPPGNHAVARLQERLFAESKGE